ncbi:MAG TPA: threonine/serine exporter family protein [Mycobacterium sp.]
MTEPVGTGSEAAAVDFLAGLGAAMIAANYPINLVRSILTTAAGRYGLTNQLLVLPHYIQLGGSDHVGGTPMRVVRVDRDLRYDQTFPLSALVDRAEHGRISAEEGVVELDRIQALRRRFPPWVSVIGYAVQSAAFALILQPTPLALLAATVFGLGIGGLELLGRLSRAIDQLLPTISAFLVAVTTFSMAGLWHVGQQSLLVLAPPLALFLPGAAITIAVIELSTREVVSGSAHLVDGFIRLAQLAFGIVVAEQLVGLTASELSVAPVNQFGLWAPWLGVAVYAVGVMLSFGPPTRFLPWLLPILLVAYSGQVVANALFGSYASGFGGGLALMFCASAISERPHTPTIATLLLPGFWLLVPGSISLFAVTQLIGANSSALINAALISILSIALGIQAGLLVWRAFSQLHRAARAARRWGSGTPSSRRPCPPGPGRGGCR